MASGAMGAVALGLGAWPVIDQMNPDASALALGSTDVDLGAVAPGQILTVKWRGSPVFVRHRTPGEITVAQETRLADLKDPQPDRVRVQNPEWLVVIGVCTHLGCVPLGHQGPFDGWLCPCHGSVYDMSGRVRSGPAPTNLAIPPYAFLSPTTLRIG